MNISRYFSKYNSLYPLAKNYPTLIWKKNFHKLILAFFFLLLIGLNSCKTCKCPAYSSKNPILQELQNPPKQPFFTFQANLRMPKMNITS